MTPNEQITDLAKTAPPIAIASMSYAGYSISDWVLLATLIYTVLQIFLLVRRMIVSRRSSDTTCTADCPGRQNK